MNDDDDDLRFGDVSGGGASEEFDGPIGRAIEIVIKLIVLIIVVVAGGEVILSILSIYLPDWIPVIGFVLL